MRFAGIIAPLTMEALRRSWGVARPLLARFLCLFWLGARIGLVMPYSVPPPQWADLMYAESVRASEISDLPPGHPERLVLNVPLSPLEQRIWTDILPSRGRG